MIAGEGISIGAMKFEINKVLNKYNIYRPHNSLEGVMTMAYITYAHTEGGKKRLTTI